MSPALAATFILFSGQNLDHWRIIDGAWAVREGAIVCTSPGRLVSCYESDEYELSFEFRNAGPDDVLQVRSGGPKPAVAIPLAKLSGEGRAWQRVELSVSPQGVVGRRAGQDAREVRIETANGEGNARGGLGFACRASGLEIRDIRVSEPGFKPLFDGKSLRGWEFVGRNDPKQPNWSVENGVLRCNDRSGSWLRTLETYDNFVIRLEYRLPKGGNSGVYLRAPLEGRVSQIGLEIQLIDDNGWGGRLKPSQRTGSVYAGISPEVEVSAPAETWNTIEILADGKRVRTIVNGVQLYDARLDDEKKDESLLGHPLATRRLTGFIGLQDHTGGPMFRNIRIKELGRRMQ